MWVSRFMSSQDSISVLHVSLLPGKTGPVFCLLTAVPLGSLPSCPGLVSAQLLEERPSNSPPVPAQLNVHLSSCFHVFSLARCLNPFYTKAKDWRQEGEKAGHVWLRGSRSVHTLCWGPLSILTYCNWSVSLGKKRPEGLKNQRTGVRSTAVPASTACLAPIAQRQGRRHSPPSGGADCSLSIPTQEPACSGLPLSTMNL